jgi:ABC-type branched-subunit amino acid transport system substrate-binding protein
MSKLLSIAAALIALPWTAVAAEPGVTDTEIKIGSTMPFSGPASSLSEVGRSEAAYFRMLNDGGGINGRKINLVALDDGYSPPKAVEQVRKLVEEDKVAFIFSPLGTPSNTAIVKYLNARKVPHLLVVSGISKFSDHRTYRWTTTALVNYVAEGRIYGKLIQKEKPGSRIAVLYQNDDLGKDYLAGLRDVFKDQYDKLVSTASYELTDPTVESQVITLKATGAEVLLVAGTPKFAAQAIRKAHDIGWKALVIINVPSSSVAATLQPAGLDRSVGVITGAITKDPDDPKWKDDPTVAGYRAFIEEYLPGANASDANIVYGYNQAMILEQILRQCGNDLSRENIMKQALNLRDLSLPMLRPGIRINTSPTNHQTYTQLQLQRWNGKSWDHLGDAISGAD